LKKNSIPELLFILRRLEAMDSKTKFMIYCIEIYRNAKKLSGKEVFKLFSHYGVLDYVLEYYEALHTTGMQYTIHDIDEFIAARIA
jgi:hypothetical protein